MNMGLFDFFKSKPVSTPKKKTVASKTPKQTKKPRSPRKKAKDQETMVPTAEQTKPVIPVLSAKEIATSNGEPYVTVVKMDIDVANPTHGTFELDFNEIFVSKLIRAGFKGKSDYDIVDQWFTSVCRNIVMETYEIEMADPENRTREPAQQNRKDLGDGRTEIT